MRFFKEVRIGDLVRNKDTREVWLAVDKTSQGIMVVNLHLKHQPAPLMMILPAHTERWVRDFEIDDLEAWEKELLAKKLEAMNLLEE